MNRVIKKTDRILRVALYIRVSSDEQVKHGLSLEVQQKSLEDYAKKHGYKVVGTYIDEGLTARKTLRKRVEFNRMIQDVKEDKIDLILFIKLDRWFRNVSDYYKTMEILEKHNCKWIATEEDYDLETSNGRLNLNIRLSISQNESDQTSDRINFVFKNRREEGYVVTGSAPFGYKVEDRRYVIDEENAEKIRDIFNYYEKCRSINDTFVYYNSVYGKLSYYSIRKYLRNSAYIGDYITEKGELIPNYTPAIISREQFERVQTLLDRNVKKPREGVNRDLVYYFDGLLYCDNCGKRFARCPAYRWSNKRQTYIPYKYNRCSGVARAVCPNTKRIIDSNIEDYLLANLEEKAREYIAENKVKASKPAKKVVDHTATIQAKLVRLRKLYKDSLTMTIEEYMEDEKQLLKQLEENKKALNEVEPIKDHTNLENLLKQDFKTIYKSLTDENKRRFWSNIIDKIYIKDGKVSRVIFL